MFSLALALVCLIEFRPFGELTLSDEESPVGSLVLCLHHTRRAGRKDLLPGNENGFFLIVARA